MNSAEQNSFPQAAENLPIVLPPEADEGLLPAVTAQDLEVLHRRDLVVQATHDLEEVLDLEVRIPHLLAIADERDPSPARLRARRALRCLHHIGSENSLVIERIGEANTYHYVEGVMAYGASRATYLGLIEQFGLSAEQATALYALREQVADETNGRRAGFSLLCRALEMVGMSVQHAASDPEAALVAFTEAGFL